MGLTIDLPDFEDLTAEIENIARLVSLKESIELAIAEGESNVYRVCNTDEVYFTSGKPPSAAYVKVAYEKTGLNGELLPLRRQLIQATSDLEMSRKKYDLMRSRIDVWRSQQATERALS